MRALSTIKGRLAVAMVFLGLLLTVIGGLGITGMHASNATARTIHENQMPGVVAVSMTEMYTASERITLDRAAIFAGTPDVDTIIGRSSVTRKRADDAWKQFAALAQTPETAGLAAKFDAQRHAVLAIIDTGYGEVRSNDQTRIRASAKALQAAFAPFAAAGAALRGAQFEEARSSYAQSQATYNRFQILGVVAILVGLAAAGLAWWSLSVSIGRPLNMALAQFDAIASGDLRRELVVTSHDEMAQLLKGLAKMQASLTRTVQAVRNGSESISVATKEIASGNLDLSSRTEEQAAALQQTVASMDELIVTVRTNTENARQASALATTASQIADRGSRVVSQVVTTMSEINDSSTRIADIISIIDGIAFQTNILALNAAVEAARAGDHGRGFAVVASEVRNLAQRSASAAKEIKTLIDTSVARVGSGTSLVGDAGRTMTEMIAAIQRVTRIMGDIASASVEQNQGLEQISASVAQMDQATQQNAALVEEATAAAYSLEDQASMLRATVSVFQLTGRTTPHLAAA